MNQRPHPNAVTIPFVTNSPPTLFVAHPLNICPTPNNEHANSPAFRVPNSRMRRELMIAANEMKTIAVDPIKAVLNQERDALKPILPELRPMSRSNRRRKSLWGVNVKSHR